MVITYCKNSQGVIYPYYICSGRHSKREKCDLKAVLIEELEHRVEEIYTRYSLPSQMRTLLEKTLVETIEKNRQQFDGEKASLQREKEKLERKQRKLLEAHYGDAIPLQISLLLCAMVLSSFVYHGCIICNV